MDGWSVCRNFLKGRWVTLHPCSYRSTCYFLCGLPNSTSLELCFLLDLMFLVYLDELFGCCWDDLSRKKCRILLKCQLLKLKFNATFFISWCVAACTVGVVARELWPEKILSRKMRLIKVKRSYYNFWHEKWTLQITLSVRPSLITSYSKTLF